MITFQISVLSGILVFFLHLEMEVPMFEESEVCLNLEYRCILYLCWPQVKHCILSSSEAGNSFHQLDVQLRSHHIDKCHQVGPTESYMVSDTQLGHCWQINTVQLLNLHQRQVQSHIRARHTPLSLRCFAFDSHVLHPFRFTRRGFSSKERREYEVSVFEMVMYSLAFSRVIIKLYLETR